MAASIPSTSTMSPISTMTEVAPTSVTPSSTLTGTPTAYATIAPHASPTLPSYANCSETETDRIGGRLWSGGVNGIFVGPVNNVTWPVIQECCSEVPIELWNSGCVASCDFELDSSPDVDPSDLEDSLNSSYQCLRNARGSNESVEEAFSYMSFTFGHGVEDSAGSSRVTGKTSVFMVGGLLLSLMVGGAFAP